MAAAGIVLLPACGGSPAASPAAAPATLAATGLYAGPGHRELSADVLPYAPQYPLWTDGAAKRRWLRLPPGTAIDASDPDVWQFPVGTRIWKEFAFGGRPVETRYLELLPGGTWRYATYVWNEDGSEATLAPAGGVRAAREIAPGVHHDIPGILDCRACHDSGRGEVLGLSALQLSGWRDPLAPHAEPPRPGDVDLDELVRRGLVTGLPADLSATPPRIAARSQRERAALGYLHGNCGHCHNADNALGRGLGLLLDQRAGTGADPMHAIASALGQPSQYGVAADGTPMPRIAAGAPHESVLLRRVSSRHPSRQMPPLGTRVVDADAVHLLEAWIRDDLAAKAPDIVRN